MINDDIQISVCITTYNSENFIYNSLLSVIEQETNFNYEIIIADDASNDKTLDIIYKILKKSNFNQFKIIKSNINKGIVSNLFAAIKATTAKYIALLDADDIWTDRQKLQSQFEILNNDNSIDYVYSNYIFKYSSNDTKHTLGLPSNFIHPLKEAFEVCLITPFMHICTICIKKEVINLELIEDFIKLNFVSQDYPLLLFLTKNFKGYYDPKITTAIILRKESLSRPASIEKKLAYFKNIHKIGTYFIELYGVNESTLELRNFKYHMKCLLVLWSSYNYLQIKEYSRNLTLGAFIKYNPKAAYIHIASHSKILYKLLRPWVLRKRPPGK